MLFNAFVFVLTAYFFYVIARNFIIHISYITLAFVIFALSVGYALIITRIAYPETPLICFLLIFLYCAIRFYETGRVKFAFFAFLFGNGVLYLKEVGFILISGFAFFHLFFSYYLKQLKKRDVIFDGFLLLSGAVFLSLYVIFVNTSDVNYANSMSMFKSAERVLATNILATPLVSIALPCMLLFRFYRILKAKDKLCVIWDSVGLVAFLYFLAYLVLRLATLYYLMPAVALNILYFLYFGKMYFQILKTSWVSRILCVLVGFIMLVNTIPQGLHYFSLNKIQTRNTQETMAFLADYIQNSQGKTTLFFEGFCRGEDKCVDYGFYHLYFSILPKIYGVDNFDIKSNESNGKNFKVNIDSPLSFYNSDEVAIPQRGDLIVVGYLSNKAIFDDDLEEMKQKYDLLFQTHSFGYIPGYNLMSFGAWVLQKLGIQHAMSNRGNPLKLPSQMFVFRVR